MYKKIALLSIFFLNFLFLDLHSEIVKDVKISGNKRISNETIKVYGNIEIGKNYDEKNLNNILQNLYSTDFFENITVEIKNNVLLINVNEYMSINQLIFIGEDSKKIKEQIAKIIALKEKSSFIKTKLSNDISLIKKLYSSVGYNNVKVETKINTIDKDNIDLIFEIDKGSETKISSINFIGDKKIKDKKLREIIVSEKHNFWKVLSKNTKFSENLINLDKRLLSNFYKSIGYYNVSIKSSSAQINENNNVDLTYNIDAGERFIISKLITKPSNVFDNNLFFPLEKRFQKYIGDFYSPFTIKKLLENIDEIIEDNNLQFVEHNVEEILDEEKNTIEVIFNIYESEKILVERINILGNNVTNESVIRAELLIDEGDPFTKLSLDKSVSKLKSKNIFRNVNSKVKDGSGSNLKVVDIEVEEKPTGEISAGAGVGTNGGAFAVSIKENNWLGEGKRIGFELDLDSESISGQLNYTNPNYNFFGNEINYFIESTSNDKPNQGYENTVITSGINTGFEQYRDLFINLGLSASFDDLRTQESASSTLKKQSGNFSEIAGNYGFKYDKRNRAFMPTSGSVVTFNQSVPFYADKQFIKNTFTASGYKELTPDVIGASKLYLSAINGLGDDDVRLSKRLNLSQKRLRGFERGKIGPIDGEDHIGGNLAAAINLETNLPNLLPSSSNADISLFLDFGNVWNVDYDSTLDDSNKIRSSTGVAVGWQSPLGPLTFTLSQNLSKASTDKTESFTFNLGTSF